AHCTASAVLPTPAVPPIAEITIIPEARPSIGPSRSSSAANSRERPTKCDTGAGNWRGTRSSQLTGLSAGALSATPLHDRPPAPSIVRLARAGQPPTRLPNRLRGAAAFQCADRPDAQLSAIGQRLLGQSSSQSVTPQYRSELVVLQGDQALWRHAAK